MIVHSYVSLPEGSKGRNTVRLTTHAAMEMYIWMVIQLDTQTKHLHKWTQINVDVGVDIDNFHDVVMTGCCKCWGAAMIVHVIRLDTDHDPLVEWIGFLAISCDCGEVPKMAGDPSVIGTRLVIMLNPKAGLFTKQIYVEWLLENYAQWKESNRHGTSWDQINSIQIT